MAEINWNKCTKKPVEVEYREVIGEKESIKTREGELFGYAGKDYIIRGIKGEIYPIEKDIFKETYSVVPEEPSPSEKEEMDRAADCLASGAGTREPEEDYPELDKGTEELLKLGIFPMFPKLVMLRKVD